MHYLTRRIDNLSDTEKQQVVAEILETVATTPETTVDKIQLAPMLDFTEEARTYSDNYGRMQGMSTGYKGLDELMKGLVPGELIVVAGKTSYGKTTLAVNIANNIALKKHPVLFVTMEMTKAQLTSKFMYLNGGDTEAYATVAAHAYYQKNDELDWRSIDGLIATGREQANVELVIIDHLHHFTRELEHVSEDLGRITKELQKNAQRHKVPIILISHVRKTYRREEATIDDLRSSSYIAQDADIVLMVGRKADDASKIRVKIEKNRNRGYDFHDNEREFLFENTKITEEGKWWETKNQNEDTDQNINNTLL